MSFTAAATALSVACAGPGLRDHGEQALAAGRLDEAISSFERALAADPSDEGARYGLAEARKRASAEASDAGDAAAARGDLDAAVQAYERALSLAPEVAKSGLRARRGALLDRQRALTGVILRARRSEGAGDCMTTLRLLAPLAEAGGQVAELRQRAAGECVEALVAQADRFAHFGDYRRARARLDDASSLAPSASRPKESLEVLSQHVTFERYEDEGRAKLASGAWREALEAFGEAAELDPESEVAAAGASLARRLGIMTGLRDGLAALAGRRYLEAMALLDEGAGLADGGSGLAALFEEPAKLARRKLAASFMAKAKRTDAAHLVAAALYYARIAAKLEPDLAGAKELVEALDAKVASWRQYRFAVVRPRNPSGPGGAAARAAIGLARGLVEALAGDRSAVYANSGAVHGVVTGNIELLELDATPPKLIERENIRFVAAQVRETNPELIEALRRRAAAPAPEADEGPPDAVTTPATRMRNVEETWEGPVAEVTYEGRARATFMLRDRLVAASLASVSVETTIDKTFRVPLSLIAAGVEPGPVVLPSAAVMRDAMVDELVASAVPQLADALRGQGARFESAAEAARGELALNYRVLAVLIGGDLRQSQELARERGLDLLGDLLVPAALHAP